MRLGLAYADSLVSRYQQDVWSWPWPQLERHLDLGSVGLDLAVLDLEVEFDHFGNAKVTQRPRRLLYGCTCSLLPGFITGADEFND
jgi:hypothetical protein